MLPPNWIDKTILNAQTLEFLSKARGSNVLFAKENRRIEYLNLNVTKGSLRSMSNDGTRERFIGSFLPRLFDIMSSKNWLHILDNIFRIYLYDYDSMRSRIFEKITSGNQVMNSKAKKLILGILRLIRSSITLKDHTQSIPKLKNTGAKLRGFHYLEVTLASEILGLDNTTQLFIFAESYEDRNELYKKLANDCEGRNKRWKLDTNPAYQEIKTFPATALFIPKNKESNKQTGECILFESYDQPQNFEIHMILFKLRAIICQYESLVMGEYKDLDFYMAQEINKSMDEISTEFELRGVRGGFYEALKSLIEEIFQGETFTIERYIEEINVHFPEHDANQIYDWLGNSPEIALATSEFWIRRICSQDNNYVPLTPDEIYTLLGNLARDKKLYEDGRINTLGAASKQKLPSLSPDRTLCFPHLTNPTNPTRKHTRHGINDNRARRGDWVYRPILSRNALKILDSAYGANTLLTKSPERIKDINVRVISGSLKDLPQDKKRDSLIGPFLPRLLDIMSSKNWFHIIENVLDNFINNYQKLGDQVTQQFFSGNKVLEEKIKNFVLILLDVIKSSLILRKNMKPTNIEARKELFRGFIYYNIHLTSKILGLNPNTKLLIFPESINHRIEIYEQLKKEHPEEKTTLPEPETRYPQLQTFPANASFIPRHSHTTTDQIGECIAFGVSGNLNSEIHGILFNLRGIIQQYRDSLTKDKSPDLNFYIAQEISYSDNGILSLFELQRTHQRFYLALKDLIESLFPGSKFDITQYMQEVYEYLPQPDPQVLRTWILEIIRAPESTRSFWLRRIPKFGPMSPFAPEEIEQFLKDFTLFLKTQSINPELAYTTKEGSQGQNRSRGRKLETRASTSDKIDDIYKELQDAAGAIDDLIKSDDEEGAAKTGFGNRQTTSDITRSTSSFDGLFEDIEDFDPRFLSDVGNFDPGFSQEQDVFGAVFGSTNSNSPRTNMNFSSASSARSPSIWPSTSFQSSGAQPTRNSDANMSTASYHHEYEMKPNHEQDWESSAEDNMEWLNGSRW